MNSQTVRVLFINHSVRDGGPGRSLFYILKYIEKKEITPYILIPKDDIFSNDLKNEGIYENVIVDERFPENVFRPRLGLSLLNSKSDKSDFITKIKKFLSSVVNIIDLINLVLRSGSIIKKYDIDIIYCNGTIAKIAGAFIGRFNNRSVIWHVRNIQQTSILKFIIKTLSKFKDVKKIVCVSNATASQFHDVNEKIRVVYNGIDPSDYNPSETRASLRKDFSINRDTVVVGSTGRLVPRKGYENLINIASSVVNKLGDNIDVKFVIVGDTPHFFQYDHLTYLKNKVSTLGLDKFFIFTGYKKDIKPYLKNFDIFVIPSNYPDPFPRSVIEAMCFNLPIVGYRIGGIAEAIENRETGFLCDPGNMDEMAKNIIELIKNEKLRISMGKSSRKRVMVMCNAADRSKDIQREIIRVAEDRS